MKTKINLKMINEVGFSLVESMLAISLLSLVVVLFTYFSSTRMTQIKSSYHKTCLQTSQDIMDKIKSVGIIKSVNTINVTNNSISRSNQPEDRLNFIGSNEDWIKNNEKLWETQGGALILKNHKALIGSMSMLNSLYNSNPAFCNNPLGIRYQNAAAQADLIDNADVGHLNNVESRIRIQTMNLNNGSLSCAATPIILRPAGVNLNQAQTEQFLGNVKPQPGSRANLGFYVTVRTSYKDEKNEDLSCEVSSSFNYPKIPPDEDLTTAVSIIITPGAISTCLKEHGANVRISTPPNFKTNKGISLVCRDASDSGGLEAARCPGGVGRLALPSTMNRTWVNCNEVTLCGKTPVNPDTAELNDGFNLNYSELSFGCNMSIEVRAIDVAHNITRSPSVGSAPLPPELPACLPCPPGTTGAGYCSPSTSSTACTTTGVYDGGSFNDGDGGADGNDSPGGDGAGSNDGDDGY